MGETNACLISFWSWFMGMTSWRHCRWCKRSMNRNNSFPSLVTHFPCDYFDTQVIVMEEKKQHESWDARNFIPQKREGEDEMRKLKGGSIIMMISWKRKPLDTLTRGEIDYKSWIAFKYRQEFPWLFCRDSVFVTVFDSFPSEILVTTRRRGKKITSH